MKELYRMGIEAAHADCNPQAEKLGIIIDCVSDLHGFYPKLDGGDLLIIAGDLTARDELEQYQEFNQWLSAQDYKRKIVIAGNHDGYCEIGIPIDVFPGQPMQTVPILADKALYLCDSGTEFEGLKIWGSPWTPTFQNWHFMKDRGAPIKEKWDLIPDNIDILITHGPPYGVLDMASGESVGCVDLRNAVDRVKPKLHIFGHVHEGYGRLLYKHEGPNTICVNASYVDEYYIPINKPIRVVL